MVNSDTITKSKFGSVALAGKFSELMNIQLTTGLFRLDSTPGPYLMVRTDYLVEQIMQRPFQVGLSFFRMSSGGLFAIFIESPVMKGKLESPFLEMGYGLDDSDNTDLVKDTLSKDSLELVLAGEGGMFGPQCEYDIVQPLEDSCRSILEKEWKQLLKYHRGVREKNYQKSMNEMWGIVPENASPILRKNI